MNLWQLKRQCRDVLRETDTTDPVQPDLLAAGLGAIRARPIRLTDRDREFGSFGCVIPMPNEDIVVFHASSSAERNHILFHELAHIFLGHVDRSSPDRPGPVCGFGDTAIEQGSHSSALIDATESEWEAETAATILSGWSSTAGGTPNGVAEDDPVLSRIAHAYGDVRRWR